MQRNIHDDRIKESQEKTPVVVVTPPKDKTPPPSTPVYIKKRKSSGGSSGGLLSCFKSKKPKPGTEQQGQPTIVVTQTSIQQETKKSIEEKPLIDYSILPDGKRIYIDSFRDRPGLDMSYKPKDFENRFVLPIVRIIISFDFFFNFNFLQTKPSAEYERPITPEIESILIKSQITEEETIVPNQSEIIEHKTHVHLEPRPATIEPVDVQPEKPSIIIPLTKHEDIIVTKKPVTIDLHGAAVNLPEIELVKPGPLPILPIKKIKKSTGGLCASCFGKKAAEKSKKEIISESIQAPIEQKKSIEKEEKKEDLSPIIEVPSVPLTTIDQPILPKVNIDIFKERNFQKTAEVKSKY